jgi:TetR/AcrR family transcriptional repressor of bet genes
MNDYSFIEMGGKSIYADSREQFDSFGYAEEQVGQDLRKTGSKRRTAPREQRREQLIRATIGSIAKHGLSDTTMATVAGEAGLSQGIINLHFKSKERLLEETLRYIVAEYREAWKKALETGGGTAAEKLAALAGVDFERKVCQRNKLAVWFAFWGESRARLTYRRICTDSSRQYKRDLTVLCEDVIREGGYAVRAEHAATGLLAINEGLWLDLLLTPADMGREQAFEISLAYLGSLFPNHFPA